MKKIEIFSLAVFIISAFSFSSCSTEFDNNKPQGFLKMSAITADVTADDIVESRAVTDASDFIVEILQDERQVKAYKTVSSMPEIIELDLGNYSVTARNTDLEEAAFDAPYYFASEDFEIKNNIVTEVGPMVCRLSNVMVTIEFSESLKAHLGSNVYISVGYEKGEKLYFSLSSVTQGQAGYFAEHDDAGAFAVVFHGVVDGVSTTYTSYCEDVKGGQHRIITYTIKDADGEEVMTESRSTNGKRIIDVIETIR